jgi:hypothetical protein
VVGDTQKRRVYNDMGNHTLYLCVHEQDKDELSTCLPQSTRPRYVSLVR